MRSVREKKHPLMRQFPFQAHPWDFIVDRVCGLINIGDFMCFKKIVYIVLLDLFIVNHLEVTIWLR